MATIFGKNTNLVIKIVLFLIILYTLDFVIGSSLRFLYFSQESGLLYRTTYSLEKANQDIIILGSSSANHHYIPSIFEDSLKLSCYNAGRDGNGLLYNMAIQKAILKRYKPKLFILDIRSNLLLDEFNEIERLSSLSPYYRDHIELRSIIELKSKFEKIKMISQIYPFNSSLITILAGNMEFNKNRKPDIGGYIPLYGNINNQKGKLEENYSLNYDYEKVKVLKEIVENAYSYGVNIMLVGSPGFTYVNDSNYYKLLQPILSEYGIQYYDYQNDSTFIGNVEFFKDGGHMNHIGASEFSKKITQRIKGSHNFELIN